LARKASPKWIVLTDSLVVFRLDHMEIRLKPETESRLMELAASSGRATEELIEDAVSGYFAELAQLRGVLDRRYDEIKAGNVKPLDGEAFFESLRRREDDLLRKNPSE
jgi:predicted transcriptional regulator